MHGQHLPCLLYLLVPNVKLMVDVLHLTGHLTDLLVLDAQLFLLVLVVDLGLVLEHLAQLLQLHQAVVDHGELLLLSAQAVRHLCHVVHLALDKEEFLVVLGDVGNGLLLGLQQRRYQLLGDASEPRVVLELVQLLVFVVVVRLVGGGLLSQSIQFGALGGSKGSGCSVSYLVQL